ncbi:MAG: hypothetical protein ACLFUO_05965, partial [Candidatus Woesearchaeota archaeon]
MKTEITLKELRKSVNNMREILNNNDKLYRYPRIISPEQESKIPAKLDIRITNKFGVALDIDSYKFDIDRETFRTKILPGSRKKLSQEEIKKLTDEFFVEIERAKNLRNQLIRIEELKELKKKTITLGLDLAGGISFTLDVDEEALTNDLYQQYNARIDEDLIRESEEMKNYISQLKTEY